MKRTGILVVLLVAVCGAARADDAFRQQVFAFEQRLREMPERDRRPLIRSFFNKLKTSEEKLEAIGMTNSRYVYAVPRSMVGELMGPLLRDPDSRVRVEAVDSLRYNAAARGLAEELRRLFREDGIEVKLAVISAMAAPRDDRFAADLESYLTHADPRVRVAATFALAHAVQSDAAYRRVADLFQDSDIEIRQSVMQVLPTREPFLPEIRLGLKDPSERVREAALRSLAYGKSAELVSLAEPMLADPHPYVQAAAVEALMAMAPGRYADRIARLLNDPDAELVPRRIAARELGKSPHPAALTELRKALKDPDDLISKWAAESIREIGRRHPEP